MQTHVTRVVAALIGFDGLRTSHGVEGRVWRDSAEVRTSSINPFGAHRFGLLRVPGT